MRTEPGRHELTFAQYAFLNYLRTSPRARVGDIATNFAIGIGATSKGMDRLERLGRVQRLPNPADRRSSLLGTTGSVEC
jgi:MarR family multiple antibiotic resistance transcriptional regulator